MVDYDLHIHTTASDGLLSPKEIFKIANDKGLSGISVTDHDTINALAECSFLACDYGMDFIPGIEISSDYKGYEIHILGYYIDYTDTTLLSFLDWMQQKREDRNKKIIKLLEGQGYNVNYEEILKSININNKSIGRPHIARLLIEKGYFNSIGEVFSQLLGAGKPAYVNRHKISIEDAANIIIKSKGIPVIAHPLINNKFNENNDIEGFIRLCIEFGIKGIEVFHTLHNEEQEKYLLELARKYKLVITGGSDCHGELIEGDYLLGSKGITSREILGLKMLKR
jgi:predicted metal-dependent phosphoesterase TrpH